MSEVEHQAFNGSLPIRYKLQQILGGLIGKRFDAVLDGIRDGMLTLTWPDGHVTVHGSRSTAASLDVNVTLHNFKPIRQLMLGGELGFAESYLCGHWSTDNLGNLFTLIIRNESYMAHSISGTWVARLINGIQHWSKRNSPRGSQRNIAYHYDLGNDFYRLWLDSSMNYSSALFDANEQTLEAAQLSKMQRVTELLNPKSGSRVLEIGCGWGAMAHTLASQTGCHVEGISLSSEQLDYARQNNARLAQADSGFAGSVQFRHQDYRAVTGRYDHIVSIEMFEAVGEEYWRTYFGKLAELLEQGGSAVLQVITILEERFEVYRKNPDFIQRYIFPGGMLPTKTRLAELVHDAGLELERTDWYGSSYARTLAQWREKFEASSLDIVTQGFDERFLRMWRYYLAYCESGFAFGTTDVGMLLINKR